MVDPRQGDNNSGDTGKLTFEQVHKKYHLEIYNSILDTFGEEQVAENLTVETFVNAYRAWDKSPDDAHVSTWLHQIAIGTIGKKQPGE